MELDSERLSKILRRLTPRQEKVVRLRFGLDCKRSHSVAEIAAEFGVSAALIAGILEAATRKLAEAGVTVRELREAARAELPSPDAPIPAAVSAATKHPHHHRRRRP